MRPIRFVLSLLLVSTIFTAASSFAANPPKVFFKSPPNGAIVTSPVKIEMGAENIAVAPAGEVKAGEGHHHLIIDGGPVKKGEVIPNDAAHLHFGKGQTEAEVQLSPGKHKLTLQFADGAHKSYGEALSSTIEVDVK